MTNMLTTIGRCAVVAAVLVAAAGTPGAATAQDLLTKAPAQVKPVMIVNATIHPVSGPTIAGGVVTFEDGRLKVVASDTDPAAALKVRDEVWEIIDARGKHIYPGLIASYSQLGLIEIAAVRPTIDYGEVGQATPEVRAGVAVNPDSTLIPVARLGGVLVAGVFPLTGPYTNNSYISGPGGMVPGRASVMKLDGWTYEQMAESLEAGLVVNWPLMRPVSARWMNRSREEQMREAEEAAAVLDRLFADAAAYGMARRGAGGDPKREPGATDLRLEAMQAVLPGADNTPREGQKPVFILANDYDQITSAVAFADKHGLKMVLVGGMDAALAADLLKSRDIPVIVTGVYRFPKRTDGDYDEPFAVPARLHAAGVRFCLSSGEEAANERNLPLAAATAVAYGLDADVALRSITLSAAEILGVSGNLGSLEPGKSATLIVTDQPLFSTTMQVEHAWIDGRRITLESKQTELEAKYREKYRQLAK